jgi:hypothetical protein
MIKGKFFKFFGVLFLFLGITIVFNSFSGITGFVVYEDVNLNTGYMVGIWFVLVGILLAAYRKK